VAHICTRLTGCISTICN